MTEYRLFPEGTVPVYSLPNFFEQHPWINPDHQRGHQQRMDMTEALVRSYLADTELSTVTDLGCGDGSLLGRLQDLPQRMWGYDAGSQNVQQGQHHGLDVRQGNLYDPVDFEYGDLLVCTEVVEHLLDPHRYVAGLPGSHLILSSPSAETNEWYYEHHTWAWDLDGYKALAEEAGWTVLRQVECDAETNYHCGHERPQKFQALVAVRNG